MSTKTNFKRIALVAVAALGLGVLSSVPSNAALIGTPTVTVTNGTATLTKSDSTTAATIAIRYFAELAGDTATVEVTLGTQPSGSSLDSTVVMVTALDTSTSTGVTALKGKSGTVGTEFSRPYGTDSSLVNPSTGAYTKRGGVIVPTASSFAGGKFGYFIDTRTTRVAGTYTFNYIVKYFSGDGTQNTTAGITTSGTFTIVVSDGTAAAATAVSAAGTSTAVLSAGTTFAPAVAGVDDVVTAASTTPGTVVGVIKITQLTSAGDPARESITVTTNIGNLGLNGAGAAGKSLTLIATADGIDEIQVYNDGSSGSATITIKTTSVTFAPKTVTFYSTSVDKYVVTRLAKVIGSATTNTLVVQAIDSQGNTIKQSTNSTVYAYSDNLDAIATAATSADGLACSGYSDTAGGHVCALSGSANGTANITIRNKSTLALSTKSSTPQAITVNLNPAVKVALSFDKATYAPGELAYLSLSAVDAAGNPVGPNAGTNYLTSAGITTSAAFGNGSAGSDSLTVATTPMNVASSGRVTDVALYTVKVYMPSSGGTITATATGGTALSAVNQVKVTASATITDNGAAALAAVTALATTVASLKTLITTLTNLVLKIQKKVKA
jgi:hypothetical protein